MTPSADFVFRFSDFQFVLCDKVEKKGGGGGGVVWDRENGRGLEM